MLLCARLSLANINNKVECTLDIVSIPEYGFLAIFLK